MAVNHEQDLDRLISGSRAVIEVARRPPGLADAVQLPPVVDVAEGRDGQPEIRIDAQWERRVSAEDLGTVVTAALLAYGRTSDGSEPVEPAAWNPAIPERDLTAALVRLSAALDASAALFATAQRRLAGEPDAAATDDRGRVRVEAQDGQVTTVSIDPGWATGKSGPTIAMILADVMTDAIASSPRQAPSDPLVADPYAALAFLKELL